METFWPVDICRAILSGMSKLTLDKDERNPMQKEAMVKTSLKLPEALWKRTKIRAIEMDIEAQELIALALEQFLKKGVVRDERPRPSVQAQRKS